MDAAIYARFSSDNQREQSIEDQLRVCRDYCKQKGLTVISEYHDSALSGLTDARPDFQRMIRDGERRVFDVLVLYSLDRFARDKYDSAIYKRRLKKAGVQIAYVTTPVGEGPEAVLMESLLEGMAQYYSENLARNVRRGLQGNALKGLWGSGSIPLGYRITPSKKLEIDPVGASTVRLIFELYDGGCTRAQIVRRLNAENRLTSTGKSFIGSAVYAILTNEIYTGTHHFAGMTIPNFCAPIIERPMWEHVQQLIKRNTRVRRSESSADYLLTGKLLCGCCGSWMIGMSGKNHAGKYFYYYACSKKSHNKGGCPKQNDPRDAVEQAVIASTKLALTDQHIVQISRLAADAFVREADTTSQQREAQAQLSEVNRKLNNLLNAVEQGIISDTLQERLTDLEAQRSAAQTALARAKVQRPTPTAAEIAFYLKSLRDGDINSQDFRRTLVDHLLNSATVYDTPEGKKIALAYNLTPDANETLDSSSIAEKVGLTVPCSNLPPFRIIGRCAVFWRDVVW